MRRRFRVKRNVYYATDIWDAPPYATFTETHSSYSVQMRILGCIWITIREFDFDNEHSSEWCANRLLSEILKF